MSYNNYFQTPYVPYQAQKYEIIRVSGRNGAEAFQMAPNSSTLLLDETAPIVWLKTTDGAGYPTLTPYSISLYQPEPEIDLKSLVARISKLEEAVNADKPNATATRKSRSANAEPVAD
mgnify:CR=1 FL=1